MGAETAYDVAEAKVTKYSAALAYACPQYTVSLQSLNKLSLFSVAYYHKVNALTEAGAKATWQRGDQQVSLELGSKYVIDKDAFVKAKIDNVGRLGLGYSQVLSKGIKVGFGGVFDTARLSNDAHKLGFSLAFEA